MLSQKTLKSFMFLDIVEVIFLEKVYVFEYHIPNTYFYNVESTNGSFVSQRFESI